MSYWLESELQTYFDVAARPPPLSQGTPDVHQTEQRVVATTAVAEDPALAFMLRLDSVLSVRSGVVTCLATVRRNVHHFELVYLQRFKQISEPAIRHPKNKEQVLLCLDPKTLRCGQQVLIKVHTRSGPTEPLKLLRECSILRASSDRDPAVFPKAYLFGCLGNHCWRVASSDNDDERRIEMHKQHFLLCQYVEDSLQRVLDANRSTDECMEPVAASRLCREMLTRLSHLHSIGWIHGDLRPACFLLLPGGEELILSDFASASPFGQDCLTSTATDDSSSVDTESRVSWVYRSARYAAALGAEAAFADLESLVYIMLSLMLPKPLPWELEDSTQASPSPDHCTKWKLATWQFIEADDSDVATGLWDEWHLEKLFNCSMKEVGEHPAYRLASIISRQHRDCCGGAAPPEQTHRQRLPDYVPLLDCLLRVDISRV